MTRSNRIGIVSALIAPAMALLVPPAAAVLVFAMAAHAQITIVAEHNRNQDAAADFKFKTVPQPARNDAAAKATFSIVEGRRDPNGADVAALHDGRIPSDEDVPAANFFFRAGTDGGRLVVDLGSAIDIACVNTYSWHTNTRGPQVYRLYGADGKAEGFSAQPKRGTSPLTCGWRLVGTVDTRPKTGEGGGQYGVSVSGSAASLGTYRYLLFDISRTEAEDPFGNTFFSEIDVLDRAGPPPQPVQAPAPGEGVETVEIQGGKYRVTLDTSQTPDLTGWARQELVPLVREWYPKLVEMLPSRGYEAPRRLRIAFSKTMRGVAATGGTTIRCGADWFRRNLKGEAKGAVLHEIVHVVQQYGRARRQPGASPPPGWLVEGIADYIRWFLYEPQTRGAEITRRSLSAARYDGSYRVSANFLNWVCGKYGRDVVPKVNAAIREGRYNEALWKELTRRTVQQLGDEWKADLATKLGVEPAATGPTSRITVHP